VWDSRCNRKQIPQGYCQGKAWQGSWIPTRITLPSQSHGHQLQTKERSQIQSCCLIVLSCVSAAFTVSAKQPFNEIERSEKNGTMQSLWEKNVQTSAEWIKEWSIENEYILGNHCKDISQERQTLQKCLALWRTKKPGKPGSQACGIHQTHCDNIHVEPLY